MLIVVLVISSVSAFLIFSKHGSTTLDLSVSLNQTNVVQGSNLQAEVNVTSIGGAENVSLGSNVGSSGIRCSFEPATGISNFTSTLTMNVPDSTPSGNYSVLVTASGGGEIENASNIISVLNTNVTVSGIVSVPYPTLIEFTELQTNLTSTFHFPLTESSNAGEVTLYNSGNSYTIILANEHTYNVTVGAYFTFLWATFIDTFQDGTLYVYAPAGNSTMPEQNFSLPNS